MKKDTFLQDWFAAAEASSHWFKSENMSPSEVEDMARIDGFRTARSWLEMRSDAHRTMKQFVHADEYRMLWKALKNHDKGDIGSGHSYSPANGGVPQRLLTSIERWHKLPKFTVSERKLTQKIAAVAKELEELLGQLVPSDLWDSQYSRFRFPERQQAIAVLKRFGKTAVEIENQRTPSVGWEAGLRLSNLGIEPLWAVQNIQLMALDPLDSNFKLPTKVRAKTTKRTWFIRALYDAICSATFSTPKTIGLTRENLAAVAGLLANLDCSADDVRKVLSKDMA